ncbi:unnamed protein product [Cyclocybe aegerita]|uniref:Uncharacterized protein n=1 Tax=Cyclocybe aegerita TaxID=1973307 RepID=A0A8S0VT62_CYCAE|nr:unnamed protein product [Cyclocybe aegerita]
MPSVLYHVRSFGLLMNGSTMFETYAILGNDCLVDILRSLHARSYGILGLALCIQGPSIPINLLDLATNFRSAFQNLLHSPFLTTLCLQNIFGVPDTLIRWTSLKHLHFHFVELVRYRVDYDPLWILPPNAQIESLDIDFTFPFPPREVLETGGIVQDDMEAVSHFCNSFSGVTDLKYSIYHSSDFRLFCDVVLGLSSSLTTIELELSDTGRVLNRHIPWPLPFHRLPLLRSLTIRLRSLISIETCGLLRHLSTILKDCSIPPSLQTIDFALELRSQAQWLKLCDFFPQPSLWAVLDNILATHPQFAAIQSVYFNLQYRTLNEEPWAFDEGVFVARCATLVKELFPLLADSKTKLGAIVSVLSLPRDI